MQATSKLIPALSGQIVRWIDSDHFIIRFAGYNILAYKAYWAVKQC